jgi:hypothetical protein
VRGAPGGHQTGALGAADGCSGRGHAGSRLSSAARAERKERVWGMTGGR